MNPRQRLSARLDASPLGTVARLFAILTVVLAISVGRGQGPPAKPQVVVSIHPLYDLVRRIAGEDAVVTRLLPPGVSTHTYDHLPSDLTLITTGDLMIINGGLDLWATKLHDASGNQAPVLELLKIPTLKRRLAQLFPNEVQLTDDGEVAAMNPHIWLVPTLLVETLPAITQALSELDPANADAYHARAADLAEQLLALHTEIQQIMAPANGAAFVPFHDAWPYFASTYGLDLIVEIEPFPGREPSLAYLQEALGLIRNSGAKAIFSEVQLNRRPAEVLAESANVALYEMDPIGGLPGRESYEELLLYNAHLVSKALGTGN